MILQDDENDDDNTDLPGTTENLMAADDENESALLLKQRPHGKAPHFSFTSIRLLSCLCLQCVVVALGESTGLGEPK